MSQSNDTLSALANNILSNHSSQAEGNSSLGANHSSDGNKSHTFTLDKNISSNLANYSNITSNDYFALPKMDNIVDILTVCSSIALIIGSLIPYVPQYLKIKRSLNSDGFSTYVCLTLLIANILRIIFWFGHRFELPLLIQSFVVITGMLILMELCVRVRDKSSSFMISSGGPNRQRRFINGKRSIRRSSGNSQSIYAVSSSSNSQSTGASLSDSCSYQNWRPTRPDAVLASSENSSIDSADQIGRDPNFRSESPSPSCSIKSQHRYQTLIANNDNDDSNSSCWTMPKMKYALGTRDFWDWDDFNSYLYFLFLFTLVVSLLTYLLIDSHLYVETLGFIAVLTESMLGLPQLLRNYSKKSTLGMSVEMVVMWLSGDLFKTLYFILRRAPVQFYVCGSIQVVVDILILYQVLWYRRSKVNYRKLPTTVVR